MKGITRADELQAFCGKSLIHAWIRRQPLNLSQNKPTVVLLVGVNGIRENHHCRQTWASFSNQGKRVLLAAADTYRAAAIDQLQVWGERLDLPVIAGQPDADPGAVAYDAVQAAAPVSVDLVLVDTAGRLHTRYNLMEELKKSIGWLVKPCPARLMPSGWFWMPPPGKMPFSRLALLKKLSKSRGLSWQSWILRPRVAWHLPSNANWVCPSSLPVWVKNLKIYSLLTGKHLSTGFLHKK